MSEKKEVWSRDQENYTFDTLQDAIFSDDVPGVVLYVGNAVYPDPANFVDADDVIEQIACRGADAGGEWADDYPEVSSEGMDELDEFLTQWARKHCQPSFYTIENSREYVLTEEDVRARSATGEQNG